MRVTSRSRRRSRPSRSSSSSTGGGGGGGGAGRVARGRAAYERSGGASSQVEGSARARAAVGEKGHARPRRRRGEIASGVAHVRLRSSELTSSRIAASSTCRSRSSLSSYMVIVVWAEYAELAETGGAARNFVAVGKPSRVGDEPSRDQQLAARRHASEFYGITRRDAASRTQTPQRHRRCASYWPRCSAPSAHTRSRRPARAPR